MSPVNGSGNGRHYANWLSGYAHYTRFSEAPDEFHFWTGVFTIASVLRRRVWIDQHIFQWTPNFWITLISPPGIATKSTSLGIGMDLLNAIGGIHMGPVSITWQGLTTSLEDAQEMVEFPDGYRDMACVSCAVSELGTFLQTDDKVMISVLTDLWDGRRSTWERRTKGMDGRVKIINPWINIMGCTTPSWIRGNFTENMISDGLSSRIVYVYADKPRQYVAYPGMMYNFKDFEEEKMKLIEDLAKIAEMKGEFVLTPEALEWGIEWYQKVKTIRPEHMISDRFGGYLSRKQTHVHKLAMVLSAAQRSDMTITKRDLELSAAMMTSLETSMLKVFESVGGGEVSRHAIEMLSYVRAYKEITQKQLWRFLLPTIGSPKEFEETTMACVKAGYIRLMQRGTDIVYIAIKEEGPPQS